MKKALLILVAVMGFAFAANAQSNAIGLRLGYGNEISYQTAMGSNRLEVDLGTLDSFIYRWGYNYFSLAGTYQWTFGLPVNGLGWYVGPGAIAGFFTGTGGGLNIGVGGIIGIDFKIPSVPIQLSADFRPMYPVFHPKGWDLSHLNWWSSCLGIRYTF